MRIGTNRVNRWAAVAGSLGGLAVVLAGCGGGGGGGGSAGGGLDGRLLSVVGTPGTLALSPKDANNRNGTNPPPVFAPTVTTENHFFRIVFPFTVDRSSILTDSPLLKPFSYLNGNITITDASGAHVPGLALVNGI